MFTRGERMKVKFEVTGFGEILHRGNQHACGCDLPGVLQYVADRAIDRLAKLSLKNPGLNWEEAAPDCLCAS